jgi:hypothetical protein
MSTRPSDRLITAKMQQLAVAVDSRIATSAANQAQALSDDPDRTPNTMVARQLPRAYCATLKASLRPRWRRCSSSVAPAPSTCASTRWLGVARHSPAARTRSLTEKVCDSRFHCTCTGKASHAAKVAAQSTHGSVTAVGTPGSVRTTMTNSATAAAATVAVNSMIR